MAITCWAPECNHNNLRETCKFYRFPKDKKLFRKWITLLRRDAQPGAGARVCSCHFREGNKANCPEIFTHNHGKLFGEHHLTPERKKRKVEGTVTKQQSKQFEQEGQTSPRSVQVIETVKQEQIEFLDTPITIKEEPLSDDPLNISTNTSNFFCVNEDCVKIEPNEDQDLQTLDSKIEDPNTYETASSIEKPPQMSQETGSTEPDPIDLMFLDFAKKFKQFSAKTQKSVQSRFCQILVEAEVDDIE